MRIQRKTGDTPGFRPHCYPNHSPVPECVSADQSILALNCGSSSLKFGAYDSTAKGPELLFEGDSQEITNYDNALAQAISALEQKGLKHFSKVGHRIVHGGPEIRNHCLLTPDILKKLQAAIPFAPLHLPASLGVIEAVRQKMPDLPQFICLDTAFHKTMPAVARTFALPEDIRKLGVERYGFHGLSLESILAQLPSVPSKLVVAHLGNGSSITAIRDGRSIDTSMGLTPTGGVMMGTRSGDLDPGVMLFLANHTTNLEDLLNHKSGLLGVSGISSDVRKIPPGSLALRMFCYQVRKTIAAMASALDGLDMLVFTGGIGEHAEALRNEICDNLTWMKPFEIRVLPAQEDLQIARIVIGLDRAGE